MLEGITPRPQTTAERHREEVLSRFDGFTLAPDVAEAMTTARAGFRNVADHMLATTVPSREQSKALDALEEAKYWTNQSLARYGLPAVEVAPDPFEELPSQLDEQAADA